MFEKRSEKLIYLVKMSDYSNAYSSNFFYNSSFLNAQHQRQYFASHQEFEACLYQQPPTPPYDTNDSFYLNSKLSYEYQTSAQNFGKKTTKGRILKCLSPV